MGGDFGPRCIIPAVARCLQQIPGFNVVLVGSPEPMASLSREYRLPDDRVSFVHTSETILADDLPASVLRSKRDASMRVVIEQVRDGVADGCLSAGNTGALMVLAKTLLGTVEGIQRPAIMAALPVAGKFCHVLDLGANVDCSARQLFEFAVMGSEAVAELTDIERPRVGLLNIGSEINKGSLRVREVSELLRDSRSLNYIGHIEGHELFQDRADVVVCDGFVGNVVLKASEGLAGYMQDELRRALSGSFALRLLAPLLRRALKPMGERLDPSQHNGAVLLGLQGVVVKSHGNADQTALEVAIGQAVRACQSQMPQRIAARLARCRGELL
ncbi:phosphate acyltransferase PlsX [Pseudomonas sp. G11-1]|nr:phosphate acyltransferase PlsX [Pseudomonas sp. G11-1]MCO5790738.1 phosphate acyltransferase PlsX [Pseudomonas sp. G11-2]